MSWPLPWKLRGFDGPRKEAAGRAGIIRQPRPGSVSRRGMGMGGRGGGAVGDLSRASLRKSQRWTSKRVSPILAKYNTNHR